MFNEEQLEDMTMSIFENLNYECASYFGLDGTMI